MKFVFYKDLTTDGCVNSVSLFSLLYFTFAFLVLKIRRLIKSHALKSWKPHFFSTTLSSENSCYAFRNDRYLQL